MIKTYRDSALTSIIDFMYCGEANVLESDLERFLDSAKDLKVGTYYMTIALNLDIYTIFSQHGYIVTWILH